MDFNKELGGVAIAKNRIAMYLCYKDIFGHNVESRMQAASQQILVSYEIYAESTTEDFITDEEFGSGPKDKFDIFNTPGSEDSIASAVIASVLIFAFLIEREVTCIETDGKYK